MLDPARPSSASAPTNPLPGVRCCYNCVYWQPRYLERDDAPDAHAILGGCAFHAGFGAVYHLHCDDFTGHLDVYHLGDRAAYDASTTEWYIGPELFAIIPPPES